jgi:hypothetical protein
MKSEISQNNIHYFENFGDIWYIILNGALLSLRWNRALRVHTIQFCRKIVSNFSSSNNVAYMTPCRIIDLFPLSNRLHLIILLIFILFIHGCADMREVVKSLPLYIHPEEKIERNNFGSHHT